MKKDITSRKDIKLIIIKFYDKLLADKKINFFFEEFTTNNSLEPHFEIITDFWEDILFQTFNYKNNPMQKHLDFNKKIKFSKEHFKIWLHYFSLTVNEYFAGENSEVIKNRAQSIATVMQIKMDVFKK